MINNNGYTIERAIHGPDQGTCIPHPVVSDKVLMTLAYNDIATWDHQLLLSFFGLPEGSANSRRVATKASFDEVVTSSAYTNLESIQLLEVIMDKMDVPWRLSAQIELINKRNAAASGAKIVAPGN